jgi:hypothetical protein
MLRISNAMCRAFALFIATALWTFSASAADLAQLQREWWQWAMSIPSNSNPIYDRTGKNCGIAQRGDVWFLAGSTGATVTRSCSVPAGVSLFVPLVNTFCFPDASFSDSFCVTDSDNFIESFLGGTLALTVDGTSVTPTDVRDETDFNFAVGANGVFGAKPGIYRATIARGFWAEVAPLSPGPHVVHIQAAGTLFALDVTYDLNVVAPTN